ncbi:hypothetical protein F4801DRAFT_581005 [Xylaria longipes]|nr:hypothetical protein F4801DRAFT_581005 [Xylaria longipes]
MADQDMRLRLVVRRHGLPELRLMWHVNVDNNPTISKLLEQLNDYVPLESEHWGLEDYVVELHDIDGTDFECLHYQLVRSVLKPDDRVFIRALDRDDHRRRRISGRLQISSDGRHLIDGVPFGRPNLRTPAGRPAIHIPPRKRARLSHTQQDGDDLDRGIGSESDSPVLLLTNGEPHRDGHTPPRTQVTGDFEDTDSDNEDADYNCDGAEPSSSNESEIEEEEEGEEEEEEEEEQEMEKDAREEENEKNKEVEDLWQEARDLAVENAALNGSGLKNGRGLNPLTTRTMSLETLDKVTILHAAFPTTPINIFEKVLAASHNDLKTTYNLLSEGFEPKLSQEAVTAWKPGSTSNRGAHSEQTRVPANPASTRESAGGPSTRKRKFREESAAEELSSEEDEGHNNQLLRKYDHAGFPPGTITSGTGLNHMAAISTSFGSSKTNGNSETTSTTLKAATEEPMEEDDDTSSSGTSSDSSDTSSSGGSSDSDDSSNSGDSSADSDESDVNEEGSSSEDSSDQSSSAASDDSDSENSDESGGGPNGSTDKINRSRLSPASESDTSDNESDSGPEEYPFQTTSGPAAEDKEHTESSESSDETADNESDSQSVETDSSSDSDEDTDDEPNNIETLTRKAVATTQTTPRARPPSPKLTQANVAPISVPPGAGKESTKRRNARRRAAILAKREMKENNTTTEGTSAGDGHAPDSETALFEARRKALLDAIATGGIEVGPSRKNTFDHSLAEADHVGKRSEERGIDPQHGENQAAVETNKHQGDDQDDPSPPQKRRRVDLGAGRRLVFGALGLRNPKNKEDEAKLRDKLQADSQLSANRQVNSLPRSTMAEAMCINNGEDPDAWKSKINCRAVNCDNPGIELSPAPFPFQQRWDPQQQALWFSKRNKRGGQSKRAQRNQAHYYNEGSQLGKKRKQNNGYETADDGFDGMGEGQDEAMNKDDLVLNYDDTILNYDNADSQDRDHGKNPVNETSQITDLDDLPSLPEDVSVLPVLRPGEARVGMVITWQKWSCSSATSWQPQLSRVTAIVAGVDDDAAALDVCLAKRDRYLDGNEKRYDHITGRRIYDKFEAPDLYEEEEVDDDHDDCGVEDGYRNVAWAEMQDPRILQEPLDTTVELDPNSNCLASIETDENSIGIEKQTEPTVPMVSSQHEPNSIADPVPTTSKGNVDGDISKSGASPEGIPGDSGVEPYVQAASNTTSHQAGQNQQTTDSAMSDISQISSPSRQLHETTSQAFGSQSPIQKWAHTSSSIRQTESPQPNTSSPMPVPATVSSHPRPEGDFESGLVTGTPDIFLPRAAMPSSASSIRSGRQPDYAIDIDHGVLDPFDATDDIDHQNNGHKHISAPSERSSLTPVPTRRTTTPDHNGKKMSEDKGTGRSHMATPTPRSPSSPSSVFCTAVTSLSTQSPSRVQLSSTASKPSTSRFARNAKYEEAMRKLDEQFDDDLSDDYSPPPPPTSSLEVKQEESQFTDSQFAPRTLDSISPPPRRKPSLPNASGSRRPPSKQPTLANPNYRRRIPSPAILSDPPSSRSSSEHPTRANPSYRRRVPSRRVSKPFIIPPGSQVVELSSDSESVYTEDYADEQIDGTYSPELGSIPTGDGWVQKRPRNGRRSVV